MTLFGCSCKCKCTRAAFIVSAIVGVVTAFLQITGVITLTPVFLWVAFGIAVAYLGILAATASNRASECLCRSLHAVLFGILGSILFALVLLAVGIVATSILSAILAGILLFFASLMVTSTACLVRSLYSCAS